MAEDSDAVKNKVREAARQSIKVDKVDAGEVSVDVPDTERDLIDAPSPSKATNEKQIPLEPVREVALN